MSDIIYPTLDLFIYDLRNGLGESENEINQNRENFQKKLPQSVQQLLTQFDRDFEVEYVELLAKPKMKKFEGSDTQYPFEGYYYPVRIGDTYGLLLDCSVNNKTQAQPTKCFAALKDEISQRLNGEVTTIGQTWMISGQLPKNSEKRPEDIAKACYQALMPGSNWEQNLEGQGQILGASIFELSRYHLTIEEGVAYPTNIQSIQENQHIIIVLYPDEATAEKAARFYHNWMRLFCYRHKILWAYGQSRLIKQYIKNYLVTIRQAIELIQKDNSHLDLKQLRQSLSQVQNTLTPYSINLSYLNFQGRTIEINLSNYKKRLERIGKQAEGESELNFLEGFSKLVTDKYLLQITKDYEHMEMSSKWLDISINTLRSRVEVDQAEHDRTFQQAVAIVGVGLTTASLVMSLKDELKPTFRNDPSVNIFIPLGYSIIAGVIAGALTWLVIRLWPRSR